MSKSIRTYEELLVEKRRLEALLSAQRELIQYDVKEIFNTFKPVVKSASFLSRFTTRNTNDLFLGPAANTLIDLVVKRFLLARAGWIKRLLVPFVLKNISSHYIANHKSDIRHKLLSFIGLRRNGVHKKTSDISEN